MKLRMESRKVPCEARRSDHAGRNAAGPATAAVAAHREPRTASPDRSSAAAHVPRPSNKVPVRKNPYRREREQREWLLPNSSGLARTQLSHGVRSAPVASLVPGRPPAPGATSGPAVLACSPHEMAAQEMTGAMWLLFAAVWTVMLTAALCLL